MCGIIGYTGQNNAVPILINGLKRLEYRGYDSSGISVFQKSGITTVKSKGRICENEKRISKEHPQLYSNCGIGHTRWATHGEPSDINSHPHTAENVSLVHNGIIENHVSLKKELCAKGYSFASETDTEAACLLIDSKYRECNNPIKAIKNALTEIKGSYAFGIVFKDFPEKIFAVKKDSPLICAKSEHGCFIASDITAVLEYTNEIFVMNDGEIATLDKNEILFTDKDGNQTDKKSEKVEYGLDMAEKSGFPHFMLKEIHEEPEAVIRTVSALTNGDISDFELPGMSTDRIKNCRQIHIAACGTAMHSGLIGKHYIEKYARIPVNVEIASEFRYKNPILCKDDIFIAISQSGETADTLAALRLAKSAGLYTLSIVNVKGSTLARESDGVIYTMAGPEIAVASTKAYTVQCCTLYMLALKLGCAAGNLSEEYAKKCLMIMLRDVPEKIMETLSLSEKTKRISDRISKHDNIFFIGRGIDSHLASEASLKLKEISYIHSEAYAAGELKHGTISLIREGTPVVALAVEKALIEKTLSNIKEVIARGAEVTIICDAETEIPEEVCQNILRIPYICDNLSFLCAASAFQLLSYHTANSRGCDIDKPRNLAKSVTVE